jgi:hypothetical protein
MSTTASNASVSLIDRILARLEDWARGNELQSLSRDELDRVAHDIGLNGDELERLAAGEADASRLLYARLEGLGLTMEAIEAKGAGTRRDMERTCGLCGERALCEHDLSERPDSDEWRRLCPNSAVFAAMEQLAAVEASGKRR